MTATVAQVRALIPQGSDLTDQQIQDLVTAAETYLFGLYPDLPARLAAGRPPSQATVDYVEASMVARVARNPEGLRMEMDGDYQYQIAAQAAAGYLTLLEEERRMLTAGRGAFTITPYTARVPVPYDGWW
ncbi:hypothetical protein ABT093_09670 [Kitasatospora sp. NPDC002551]|uniref:hypothetical protein n=1 Tax=Kitasatospora sp. NPDC002551 TaxID=3154539 RepID=UPI00332D0FCC